MENPAKILVGLGVTSVVIGLLWHFGARYLSFGRLPGDIVIEKENFKFYFPIVTSVVLSVLLSLFFYILRLFK